MQVVFDTYEECQHLELKRGNTVFTCMLNKEGKYLHPKFTQLYWQNKLSIDKIMVLVDKELNNASRD